MRASVERADALDPRLGAEEDPVHQCNLESIRHLPSCADIGSGLASSWEEMRLQKPGSDETGGCHSITASSAFQHA